MERWNMICIIVVSCTDTWKIGKGIILEMERWNMRCINAVSNADVYEIDQEIIYIKIKKYKRML